MWAHQSEITSAFAENTDKPDVAIELPTGTGKTLTGLLVAERTRRSRRVVYASPAKQVAMQVVAAAKREPIGTALMVGKRGSWPEAVVNAYESAEQIAVTTYSSVFDSNPRFGKRT